MLIRTFPYAGSAADIFRIFRHRPHAFLLESSLAGETGRYSFIGFSPVEVIRSDRPDALDKARERFRRYRIPRRPCPTPFPGGLAGFLSYDLGLCWEKIPCRRKQDPGTPLSFWGCYDTVITIDHILQQLHIVAHGWPQKNARAQNALARERMRNVLGLLNIGMGDSPAAPKKNGRPLSVRISSDMTRTQYTRTVRRALRHIAAGDIYQVNLSQRFAARGAAPLSAGDAWRIYETLRALSPSGFSAYFNAGDCQVISSSPELFLQLSGREVVTRPMKGTRPRGRSVSADRRNRSQLEESGKDIAELLMITDLERNDLGRVCEYGSVHVRAMRTLEEYATVFQATSTVRGVLRRDRDVFDLLKACFPGGSITGCPKIRAMQIIEKLEPSRRGLYTGSMGYVSSDGNAAFNILIRTLVVRGQQVHFHAGGGIVADSDPRKEYQETLVKAKAMQEALRLTRLPKEERVHPLMIDGVMVSLDDRTLSRMTPGTFAAQGLFETIRAEGQRALFLEEHLARLSAGLKRLRMACPYPAGMVRRQILKVLKANDIKVGRLRLMIWKDGTAGEPHLAVMVLPYQDLPAALLRRGMKASIAPQRLDERSPSAGLKSLDHRIFAEAFRWARAQGFEEAVLLNRKGEVAEASRANIFFIKDGVLHTPSLATGCLPGVIRGAVLKTARRVGLRCAEGRFSPEDLALADEVFCTNSLTGIVPVRGIGRWVIGDGRPGPVSRRLRALTKGA